MIRKILESCITKITIKNLDVTFWTSNEKNLNSLSITETINISKKCT